MKLTWKKTTTTTTTKRSHYPNLPFDLDDDDVNEATPGPGQELTPVDHETLVPATPLGSTSTDAQLAHNFQSQGDKLAEDGRYREALGKWEAALMLLPEKGVLHEQKAQVLLEIGDAWSALKAATRATELEPSWAEAWITLGRTQLNFGEPDSAIISFDKALAIKPDSKEAQDDRQTAMHLVKKRKQLHLAGLSATENRFVVGGEDGSGKAL